MTVLQSDRRLYEAEQQIAEPERQIGRQTRGLEAAHDPWHLVGQGHQEEQQASSMDEQIQQLIQALQSFFYATAPLSLDVSDTLNIFVFFVQWSAIILSALTGLYAARKHGMDFYGGLVIAFIVALGGGTIRDVLLGRQPIFWVALPVYAVTVVLIALLSLLVGREAKRRKAVARVAQPIERITDDRSWVVITIDALALGLWAYLGTLYALKWGTPAVVAPIMGIITASFGGVLRDVFLLQCRSRSCPANYMWRRPLSGPLSL